MKKLIFFKIITWLTLTSKKLANFLHCTIQNNLIKFTTLQCTFNYTYAFKIPIDNEYTYTPLERNVQ